MKTCIKLCSYGFMGFGICLLLYMATIYGRWVFFENSDSAGEGLYVSMLINARNITDHVLGIKTGVPEYRLPRRNFYLSIPTLGITKATVTAHVNSKKEDVYFPVLKESIAHYEGTALPGEDGNVFLYGHSVLPQFFDTQNYLTIFSRLPDIKIGDEVTITTEDKNIRYVIFDKKVVEPTELQYLKPMSYNTLTLMTCVPPGLSIHRLLVFGRQIN